MNPPPPPPAASATADEPTQRWGLKDAVEKPKHLPLIDAAGEFFGFVYQGLRGFRTVGEYSAEAVSYTHLTLPTNREV